MSWLDDHQDELRDALRSLDEQQHRLERWGQRLATVFAAGGRLLAAGNGGSAAEAQHLTAELVGRFVGERRPLSAVSLHAESSSLTAIVNDYGIDEMFARQVQAHGRPGDVLVLLSTSGRSSNILRAAERAASLGIAVWAMTGSAPNPLAQLADEALAIDAPSTAAVQTAHLVAVHGLCAAVDAALSTADSRDREVSAAGHLPAVVEPDDDRPSVVVVGDLLLDRDIDGSSHRLCPDAPVPVVDVGATVESPGGAGLAALLCATSGTRVTLIAPVADDAAGARLRRMLSPTVQVVALPHDGPTRVKTRVRSSGQTLVRFDEGGPGGFSGSAVDLTAAADALSAAAAVLVADYGGMTGHPAARDLLTRTALTTKVVWDPHPRGGPPVPRCTLVTPNLAEASTLADRWAPAETTGSKESIASTGSTGKHPDQLAARWRTALEARGVAVTAGAQGAFLAAAGSDPLFLPAVPADGDPCGAGDRFAASATVALAGGAVLSEAVERAVLDAGAWVRAGGAAGFRTRSRLPAQHDDVDPAPVSEDTGNAPDESVRHLGARLRTAGRLVATGGCFDLIHPGHVATLQAARRLGEALVVVLNSDASVRRLKGPDRPVVSEADRARVLRAFGCVDAVVVFDEDDPRAVLEELRPDIWVKGGDYGAERLPEAEVVERHGGRVILLPYLDGRSTTGMVRRLQGAADPS